MGERTRASARRGTSTLAPMKETLEREIKLAPEDGFVLPELGGRRLPTRVFISTYHDTQDLRLARHAPLPGGRGRAARGRRADAAPTGEAAAQGRCSCHGRAAAEALPRARPRRCGRDPEEHEEHASG